MTTVQVLLPTLIGPAANASAGGTHATITHPTLGTVTVPITDPAADYGDTAIDWGSVERPQRTPLLLPRSHRLHTVTLKMTLIGPDYTNDQAETLLEALQTMADDPSPVVVNWGGSLEAGSWQITTFTASSVRRRPGDNHIVIATASIELTGASLVPPAPGQPPPPPKVAASNSTLQATAPRRATVQAGQTLFSISQAAYGTSLRWRDIAQANGLTDVRTLTPGLVLTIPS